MKVRIGDIVASDGFGAGPVIAMTKQWCIYKSRDDEIAIPWDEIYIPHENNYDVVSSIESKELS